MGFNSGFKGLTSVPSAEAQCWRLQR